MLLRTAALNNVQHRLIVFQNALSDRCFEGKLTPFNPSNPGSTALTGEGGGSTHVITLDNILMIIMPLMNNEGIPFFKVDIEGSEPEMFSTTLLLWKHPPALIFMEVFVERIARDDLDAATFLDYFFRKGYDIQIFPRLNLHYNHQDIIRTSQAFDAFVLNHLAKPNVEMDVMLYYTGKERTAIRHWP
jgi:hypothetical protein